MTLSRGLARRLQVEARTTGRSVSAIVREALDRYFEEEEPSGLPSFVGAGDSGQTTVSKRSEEILAARFQGKRAT